MNFTFDNMGYKVKVTQLEKAGDEHIWMVEVDGNWFCNVHEISEIAPLPNEYMAYNSYGDRTEFDHNRENGIKNSINSLMTFLF